MKGAIATVVMLWGVAAGARPPAPLYDPVSLNIGLNCQWQQSCITKQQKAMNRALKFVQKKQPPSWRIQLCNRNASRTRSRVDWIGFENCVHNAALRPLPPRAAKKRVRRLTSNAEPLKSSAVGERGD